MADKDLNIVIRLNDQISKALTGVSQSLDDFGKAAKSVGRDVKEIGGTMALAGGAITGPFILAINAAAKESAVLNGEINKLRNITIEFQQQVAQAVLPVVQQFTNVIANLHDAFKSIPPELRETILQGTLVSGIFLTIAGIVTTLIGKVFLLVANISSLLASFLGLMAANLPLVLLLASISAIVAAMFKWKAVSDTIVSTFEVIFRFLMNGFHTVEMAIGKMVEAVLNGLLFIVDGLAKIPGPTQQAFQGMADQIRHTARIAGEFANFELQEVIKNTEKIGDLFQTGQGEWSQAFDGFKQGASDAIQWVKGLANETQATRNVSSINFKQFAQDAKGALTTLQSSLQGASAMNKEFAKAAQAVAIAMAIINTAEGVTRALKDYPYPINLVIGGIIAAAGAIQIATIASQKFHSGGLIKGQGLASDEVPIVAQTGEGVLSRRGMSALGGEENLNLLNSGRRLSSNVINNSSNIYIESPRISSNQDISKLGEELGFAIDGSLRSARGF